MKHLLLTLLATLSAFAIRDGEIKPILDIGRAQEAYRREHIMESLGSLKHAESIKSMEGEESMMGIEPLHWRIPFVSVESTTSKCQIKCTKVCRKILSKAVRMCQGLKIGCVMGYFSSSDNDENCKIKCE